MRPSLSLPSLSAVVRQIESISARQIIPRICKRYAPRRRLRCVFEQKPLTGLAHLAVEHCRLPSEGRLSEQVRVLGGSLCLRWGNI